MKAGWETKSIGAFCTLMTGGTPKRSDKLNFEGGEIPWLVSGDIHADEITSCEGRITEVGLSSSSAKFLPLNSVMIALNGQGKTRGSVALLRMNATCNQSLVAISPKEDSGVLPEYLFHNLRGRYQDIRRLTGDDGNDRRGLNMKIIRKIEIPLPPLEEQRRIVAVLDAAFAKLDRARENVEANLADAATLRDSVSLVFFAKQLDGEPTTSIAEICNVARGGSPRPIKAYLTGDDNGINWIKIGDAEVGAKTITSTKQKIKPEGRKRSRYVKSGDFLLSNSMSFGRPYVLEVDGCIHDGWLVLEPDYDKVTKDYLFHILSSPYVHQQFEERAAGSTVRNLNIRLVSEVSVPLPGLDKQAIFVEKLERIMTEEKRMTEKWENQLADLDALRQSLLQRAFAGELT